MQTVTFSRDVVFDDVPWLIPDELYIQNMRDKASAEPDPEKADDLRKTADDLILMRSNAASNTRRAVVTMKSPTFRDRTEIRFKCTDSRGVFQPEMEPAVAVDELVLDWKLFDLNGEEVEKPEGAPVDAMPVILVVACYNAVLPHLYPESLFDTAKTADRETML